LRKALEAIFRHKVRFEQRLGSNAHAIVVKGSDLVSGVDPRGLGAALGY
jgi:gamma-glutamyltranspeptidase